MVKKNYIVRLKDEERKVSNDTIDKLKGTSQKASRARILRQFDADGPKWTDRPVAETSRCRARTVQNIR